MDFYKEIPPKELSDFEIEFFYQEAKSSFLCPKHIHSAIEFHYIAEGEYRIDIDDYSLCVHPGDLVLIRSNVIHSIYRMDKGNSKGGFYVLKFSLRFLSELFKGADNSECIMAFLKHKNGGDELFCAEDIPLEIKSILEKMSTEYNSGNKFMLTAEKAFASVFVLHMFRELLEPRHKAENAQIKSEVISCIYESTEYINENYASNFTALGCAQRANLSYSYYAKVFKAVTGKNFKKYIADLRLAKAYNMLLGTDLPVTEIAFCCGYNSSAHFTAEYRKFYKVTPSETRKLAQQN